MVGRPYRNGCTSMWSRRSSARSRNCGMPMVMPRNLSTWSRCAKICACEKGKSIMLPFKTVIIAAVLAGTAAQAKPLRSSDIYPADYPTVQAMAHMGRLISERTGGRLSIKPLGENDQDTENYTVAEVKNGTLDMARVSLATLNNTVPASIVVSLPYLFTSTAHMRRVLDGPIGDEILASMESQGIIGLGFYDMGWRSYIAKKPIRNVGDIKGLKIRVQQVDIWKTMVEAMGAEAIKIPDGRAYHALRTSVTDAAESTLPAYVQWRNFEVAEFYSQTEHTVALGVLIFSKKVWAGLSREDQTIIRAAAKESVSYFRKVWDESKLAARKTAEAAGATIVTDVDKKSFSDVLTPFYAQILTDPKLQDMVKRIQAAD